MCRVGTVARSHMLTGQFEKINPQNKEKLSIFKFGLLRKVWNGNIFKFDKNHRNNKFTL